MVEIKGRDEEQPTKFIIEKMNCEGDLVDKVFVEIFYDADLNAKNKSLTSVQIKHQVLARLICLVSQGKNLEEKLRQWIDLGLLDEEEIEAKFTTYKPKGGD
jgi:Asp-tRNA(Asn)/Glu-tRNA(Gln) amidotransferase B subunit